jgi:hypothetical protein
MHVLTLFSLSDIILRTGLPNVSFYLSKRYLPLGEECVGIIWVVVKFCGMPHLSLQKSVLQQ